MQANIDGILVQMVLTLIPFFIFLPEYTLADFIEANCFILLLTISSTFLNFGLNSGKAGPVQALENLKTIWQVLFTIGFTGAVPNSVEIAGCLVGLAGMAAIVLQKREPAPSEAVIPS